MPANCICSHKGPVLISPGNEFALLALANSSLFKHLVYIESAASAFEIGAIQRVPLPEPFELARSRLTELGQDITTIYARTACLDETDIGFFWPEFLCKPKSIAEIGTVLESWLEDSKRQVDDLLRTLDAVVCDRYHVERAAFPPNDYEDDGRGVHYLGVSKSLPRLLILCW